MDRLIDLLLGAPDNVPTPGPNDVVFTQYLRPNGRKCTVWIEQLPATVALARQLEQAGYRFECEELTTGAVSLTVEPPDTDSDDYDGPTAIQVIPNGPRVPPAVAHLIEDAHAKAFKPS